MAERDGFLGEVIDRRVQVYGDPVDSFARIAQVWSGILGHTVNAVDVPLMMVGLKAVRAQVMPDYSDNSDDIDGYMDIFRTLVGDDMIEARSVNEFIAQKWPEPEDPNQMHLFVHDHTTPIFVAGKLASEDYMKY